MVLTSLRINPFLWKEIASTVDKCLYSTNLTILVRNFHTIDRQVIGLKFSKTLPFARFLIMSTVLPATKVGSRVDDPDSKKLK